MDVSNDMLRHMKTDFLNTVYNLILEAALSRTLAPEHYLLSLVANIYQVTAESVFQFSIWKIFSTLGLSRGIGGRRDGEYFITVFGISRTFQAWEQRELLSLTTV